MTVRPCTLAGQAVRLEPLTINHAEALFEAASAPGLWEWTTSAVRSLSDMRNYIGAALEEAVAQRAVPFVTQMQRTGQVIGSTRFANIAPEHKRVEIGWTFVTPAWQRTAVNTEAKYLMFRHAFEVWGCVRVELKTNARNERSRAAILRVGATEEGTLRRHMINDDGSHRDTVYFSVIDEEWPRVKGRLEYLLARS